MPASQPAVKLRPGDHVCLPFGSDEERLDILTAYIHDGLRANHRVVAYTDALSPITLRSRLAGSVGNDGLDIALASGQVRIVPAADLYSTGTFEPDRMIDEVAAVIDAAQRDGYEAVRLAGDMSWAAVDRVARRSLLDYEARFNLLFGDHRAIGICEYDRRRFDADYCCQIAAAHPGTVTGYGSEPLLHFHRRSGSHTLTLTGEADASNREAFRVIVTDLVSGPWPVTIDAVGLRFIDVAAASTLIAMARRRRGLSTTVRCGQPMARMLRWLDAGEVPGLTIQEI